MKAEEKEDGGYSLLLVGFNCLVSKTYETEIQAELQRSLSAAITDEEFQRAMQLVGNGHRFSLEAPGAVAASVGSQTLWGRHRDLLAPLQDLLQWEASSLRDRVMPLLQPQRSFTLIARSEDNS